MVLLFFTVPNIYIFTIHNLVSSQEYKKFKLPTFSPFREVLRAYLPLVLGPPFLCPKPFNGTVEATRLKNFHRFSRQKVEHSSAHKAPGVLGALPLVVERLPGAVWEKVLPHGSK